MWYRAAAKWEEILRREELQLWYQLTPGMTVIFDNHRVLHGRSAFTGLRRICGGYSECFLSQVKHAESRLPHQVPPFLFFLAPAP
jgi:hypothetical protein